MSMQYLEDFEGKKKKILQKGPYIFKEPPYILCFLLKNPFTNSQSVKLYKTVTLPSNFFNLFFTHLHLKGRKEKPQTTSLELKYKKTALPLKNFEDLKLRLESFERLDITFFLIIHIQVFPSPCLP